MEPYKIIKTETAFEKKFCKIMADTIQLPDGTQKVWYRQEKPDAVIVCPILPDGGVLMQKEYRYGAKQEVIEFCAGWIDDGEEALATAKRELLEETGYVADTWTLIGKGLSNPAWSGNMLWIYVAENCVKKDNGHLQGVEQIEPFVLPSIEAAKAFVTGQEYPDATAMAVLGYLPEEILTRYKK